jgi:hypothetical protein
MKRTKTGLFALTFALVMTLASAACSNGDNDNSGSGFTGADNSGRPAAREPENGGLAGMWAYRYLGSDGTTIYIYNFKEDGGFEYFVNQNRIIGNYSASDGKIYLTDLIHTYDNTKWGEDKTVEYAFGADNSGAYLQAGQINRDGTYFELKPNSMKYHKEN